MMLFSPRLTWNVTRSEVAESRNFNWGARIRTWNFLINSRVTAVLSGQFRGEDLAKVS